MLKFFVPSIALSRTGTILPVVKGKTVVTKMYIQAYNFRIKSGMGKRSIVPLKKVVKKR